MIISPCISICKTDPSTGYCHGCGRSNEEKRLWKLEETTDDWKKENIIVQANIDIVFSRVVSAPQTSKNKAPIIIPIA